MDLGKGKMDKSASGLSPNNLHPNSPIQLLPSTRATTWKKREKKKIRIKAKLQSSVGLKGSSGLICAPVPPPLCRLHFHPESVLSYLRSAAGDRPASLCYWGAHEIDHPPSRVWRVTHTHKHTHTHTSARTCVPACVYTETPER